MSRRKDMVLVAAGLLIGLALAGPANAAVEYLTATRSACPIYMDGQKVELEAYMINDQNYVKLRDIGQAVNFNVYWDGSAAQVESDKPYTGEPPVREEPATPAGEAEAETEAESYSEMRLELVRLVNEARRANGVGELAVNDALMNAAQISSEQERSWHDSKADCETVLACGYPHGFGSNITAFSGVADANTAQRAVTNWLNSPGHRATMLDPDCDTIGVGITKSDRGVTFCYLFVGNPNTHNPYGND